MRLFRVGILFVAVAALTTAFTYQEAPHYRHQASASSFAQIHKLLDSKPSARDSKLPLRNLVVTNRTIRFQANNQLFRIQYVGGKKVAMKLNDLEILHSDLSNKEKLARKVYKYFGLKLRKKKHAFNLLNLIIPQAHAQTYNYNYYQPQPQTTPQERLEIWKNLFNVQSFQENFLGPMIEILAAFNKWQMDPNNPYGFHPSQMPQMINIPKVPSFQ